MSLTSIDGKKLGDTKPKEPQERLYQFVIRNGQETNVFTSFGVLVVTPGFIGIGDKEGTEIRTVVPLDNVVYVKEAEMAAAQGSA